MTKLKSSSTRSKNGHLLSREKVSQAELEQTIVQ